jgi:hypothetical protein
MQTWYTSNSECWIFRISWIFLCFTKLLVKDAFSDSVLDYFTEKSFQRKFLTDRPFDRNTIWPNTVWPNAIWPKVQSTESPFNRTPFDRKFLSKGHMTDFFSENGHLTESTFDKKCHLTRSFDRKFIWLKVHLTESFFWKWSIDQKVIVMTKWPFFEKKTFGQMTIFRKKSIWSNEISLKWPFFRKSFRWYELSVLYHFGHLTSYSSYIFGQTTFW